MSAGDDYILGLDLGGTRLKALCLTPAGEEIDRATAPSDGVDWRRSVKACVDGLLEARGRPEAIGVAAPGLASADGRRIAHMPGRLPGLEGLDWRDFLEFSGPVRVINDAHAALLGEVWRGAARAKRDVILLTLGTGVGGAILSGGRLLRGHLGRAGHLGHISIRADGPPDIVNTPGSLEDAVGNHSLGARSGGRFESTADLVAAMHRGDAGAADLWARTIRDLAAGIASLINVTDPEIVVIGGGIAEAGDALLRPLAAALDRVEWRPTGRPVPLVRALLGDWAGASGAAAHALQPTNPCHR